MITNTDKDGIFFMFLFCLGFLVMLLAITSLKNEISKVQTETDELRLLFNQKFLQEMVVNKPAPRDYNNNNLFRFEF